MNKIFSLFLLMLIYSSIFAQSSEKLEPGELFAAPAFDAMIPLHWVETGNPTEYHVYRKEGSGEFAQIAIVPTGSFASASYIDESSIAGVEYTYIIKDQDGIDMTNESSAICNNTGFSLTIPGWNTTTPTIDGIINAGEWDDAVEIDITNYARIYTSNIWTSPTYAYLKVADDKLYIAIKDYNSPTLEQNDQVMMFFDYNNDGLWTEADHDQRYIGVWLSAGGGDLLMDRTELMGTYPNITFGEAEYQPNELSGWVAENTNFTAFEFSLDITGSYLQGHMDNFGLLLQTSIYEGGQSQGLSGLYSPGGIWKAPSTFINSSVQYDADEEPPVVESIEGTSAIAGNDMTIILTISDQSEIQNVNGTYTIDGGTPQELVMSPSKSIYGYQGVIPAESEEVSGVLNFYLEDSHGNSNTTSDYNIEWLEDHTPPTIIPISTPSIATPLNIPIVTALITDDLAGVESVSLFYTISGQSEQVIPMSYIDGIYTAELPDQLAGASASYYIYATDYSENSISSEIFNILWYQGGWYGHVEGQNTGNNFGSVEDFTMGLVLELGEFEGKINKLAYMIPEYFNPPFSWKIVDVNINGNEVEWTDDVLVPEQTVTDELLYNASNWTEIEVETQANLTGTVGLVLELQAYSYWGRDANSTSGISWFVDNNTGQWAQLGVGYWIDFPGDWTLKAHLYDEDNVGFEKIVGNMGINIYPNPASDYVIIDFQLITDQDINMELFDIKGQSIRKIASSHLKEGNYNLQINTSDLSNGVYFIKSTMGKTLSTKQFVVNK